MSNSQLNKLESALKNGTEVTLNLSSNFIRSSNDETNFPHKLLLTDAQVSKIRKAFANGSSANVKFSKTQLPKMVKSGGFVHFTSNENPFIKAADGTVSLADSYVKELAKRGFENDNFVDAGLSLLGKMIKKGILSIMGSGIALANNEIKYIMKVIKSLENRGILLKGTTRKITSQEGRFLNFPRPLMTAGLPLMKNVLIPLAKRVLLPLGLSAGMSAADPAIQKKIC